MTKYSLAIIFGSTFNVGIIDAFVHQQQHGMAQFFTRQLSLRSMSTFDDDNDDSSSFTSRRRGVDFSHGYERDMLRDSSNVNIAAVDELISERSECRRRGDYDIADEIRDELLTKYAVGINDRERLWRTGCSINGSGMSRGYSRPSRGRGRDPRDKVDFGPLGHDYNLSVDATENNSDLKEDDIHELLAERLQAKLAKNFRLADDIQAELISFGVYVHDGFKQWRADGIPFQTLREDGNNEGRRMRNGSFSPYQKSEFSLPLDVDEGEILEALLERERYRATRDFRSADKIRDYLATEMDIDIDDRLRLWSKGGSFGDEVDQSREMSRQMQLRDYSKAPTSEELDSPEDEDYIQQKVEERRDAKLDKNYSLADEIRDELLEKYHVVIHDKVKQWSVGGDFGDATLNKASGVHRRRGGGNLSDEDVKYITSQIRKRVQAKQDRDYDLADNIRESLLEEFSVTIDDFCNEWRVATVDYVQAPGSVSSLDEDDILFIQQQLKIRSVFKKDRDYESSDKIRDDLTEQFGIRIDDRTKEWKVVGAKAGVVDRPSISELDQEDERITEKEDLVVDRPSISELDQEDERITEKEDLVVDRPSISELDQEDERITEKEDLAKLTVVVLKRMLKERGLKVSGIKQTLIDRLVA